MDNDVKPSPPPVSATPASWRLAVAIVVLGLAAAAYLAAGVVGLRGRALLGVFCFLGVAAFFSSNLRALNWRTLGWGFGLQVLLVLFVL